MSGRSPAPFRVVLIGDPSVGKTSILTALIGDQFNPFEQNTITANWHLHIEEVNSERVELQIWDTAGQECYRSIGPLYYRLAVAGIVVFDVTSLTSFANVRSWVTAFHEAAGTNVSVFLVGNKIDLVDQRLVQFDDASQFANEQKHTSFETSARSCIGIHELFQAVAEKVARKEIVTSGIPALNREEEKNRWMLLNFGVTWKQ
jgi:small GTP-binding protein